MIVNKKNPPQERKKTTHIILKNLIYKSHKKVEKKFPASERKKTRPKGRKKIFR
jgi:hypothetical protein